MSELKREKTIRVEFFAQFREDSGVAFETLSTSSSTPAELFEELDRRHGFRTDRATARVAVNDAMAAWNTRLDEGDTVVFLTPFGGG